MAIDEYVYHEVTNLAHPHKSFYPLRIPVAHWQLRHYISNPEPNRLYYASGHDIFCLNTATRKRRLIARLPFEARCTASGYGWVCVGGEVDGRFAAVKVESEGRARAAARDDDDDDLRVRREGDYSAAHQDEHGIGSHDDADVGEERRSVGVRTELVGEEIVNSISIHRIADDAANLHDVVAILTNNDKTVRVYSLPEHLETAVIDLPFPINHATLSPDGKLLIAVGDMNKVFFFQRELLKTPPQIPTPHNRLSSQHIRWRRKASLALQSQHKQSPQGYFTTSWSPNGNLVAVGSEAGYISVFDTEILRELTRENNNSEDADVSAACVATIAGSRPDFTAPHPGAIRSMVFSPEPWDLLIWAEDHGRVGIGDLRTGLRSRQILQLDPSGEGEGEEGRLEKVVCEDVPPAGTSTAIWDREDDGEDFEGNAEEEGTDAAAAGRPIDDLEAEVLRGYREASPENYATVNFAIEYAEARRRQRLQREETTNLRRLLIHARAGEQRAAAEADADAEADMQLEDDPQGLTAREQQILESLRSSRRREEARIRREGHAGRGQTPSAGGSGFTYPTSETFRDPANRSNNSANTSAALDSSANASAGSGAASNIENALQRRTMLEMLDIVQEGFPELSRTNAASSSDQQQAQLAADDDEEDDFRRQLALSDLAFQARRDATANRSSTSPAANATTTTTQTATPEAARFGNNVPASSSASSRLRYRIRDSSAGANRGPYVARRREEVMLTPPRTEAGDDEERDDEASAAATAAGSDGSAARTIEGEGSENAWRIIEEHMRAGAASNNTSNNNAGSNNSNNSPASRMHLNSAAFPNLQSQPEVPIDLRARALARQRERWRSIRAAEERDALTSTSNNGNSNSSTSNTRSSTNSASLAETAATTLQAFEAARADLMAGAGVGRNNSNNERTTSASNSRTATPNASAARTLPPSTTSAASDQTQPQTRWSTGLAALSANLPESHAGRPSAAVVAAAAARLDADRAAVRAHTNNERFLQQFGGFGGFARAIGGLGGGGGGSGLRGGSGGYLGFGVGGGSREFGVRTAGLAVSDDGRLLWVATEEGIFEIKLEVKARLAWPAFEFR